MNDRLSGSAWNGGKTMKSFVDFENRAKLGDHKLIESRNGIK